MEVGEFARIAGGGGEKRGKLGEILAPFEGGERLLQLRAHGNAAGCEAGEAVHEERVKAAGGEQAAGEFLLGAVGAEDHGGEGGVLAQVERSLGRGERAEPHGMTRFSHQGGERTPAGDEHARRGAGQPFGEQSKAAVPLGVLAGGGGILLRARLQIRLEIIQHEQDGLVAHGAEEIVREFLVSCAAGELRGRRAIYGVGGIRFHVVMVGLEPAHELDVDVAERALEAEGVWLRLIE